MNQIKEKKVREINYLKKCPICKKEFDTLFYENYAWKLNNCMNNYDLNTNVLYFCSYTCMRKYSKRNVSSNEIKVRDKIKKELDGKVKINNTKDRW